MGHSQPKNDGKVHCLHFNARVEREVAAAKFNKEHANCFGCGGKGHNDPLYHCQIGVQSVEVTPTGWNLFRQVRPGR